MPFVVLGISILLIVIWGLVDRKSIRSLGSFTKVGIVTYLIACVLFGTGMLVEDAQVNMMISFAGAVFALITILAIINIITNAIAHFNISKSVRTFLDASIIAILFGVVAYLAQTVSAASATKDMLVFGAAAVAVLMVLVAIVALLVIVMKILFGSEPEAPATVEQADESTDSQA